MGALVPGLELGGDSTRPAAAAARPVGSDISWADRFGALRMRLGMGRNHYRVEPGLYRLGSPDATSPVLVTANYKLTFDVLRSKLAGLDAWILVLDTKGINVWCAAGKRTFSTEELCRRILEVNLYDVVEHRTVVLPQLGAPGIAAHDVRAFTEFRVVYGPIRAEDIGDFLANGMKATEKMREVTFSTWERFVLTGVELSVAWQPKALAGFVAAVLASGLGIWGFSVDALVARGGVALAAGIGALLGGAFATPLLLPWLPGRLFAVKGAVVGAVLGAALYAAGAGLVGAAAAAGAALALVAVASYAAMNYTGTTPFTSPSGVQYEMRRALPWQLGGAVAGVLLWLASAFFARGW